MIQTNKLNHKGDTLVEVLLATVILSIVLAGAYTLSNRATRINQQAYERTQVSNLMQEQAEYLRAIRDTDAPAWDDVLNELTTPPASAATCKTTPIDDIGTLAAAGSTFHLADSGGNIQMIDAPKVYGFFYIWVEGVSTGTTYADFVINACWEGLSTVENQQSGMVIRLEREI